jgi:ATP-dependent helicase/nuclease subunit A
MTNLAYEHNGQPIARPDFHAIACDPRRSVAVEACAGAGKTWMLVSRIVRALLAGAKPHEILAITFTKKAAGEMRKRLQDWLAEWSQAAPEQLAEQLALRGLPGADVATCEALKHLYASSLTAPRPVQVRTFHSWFAALLAGAPMSLLEQLGLPARFELLLADKEAVARVWRPFHLAVANDAEARRDFEAVVAEHGRSGAQKALTQALSRRVEFARADRNGAVDGAVKSMAEQFPRFAGVVDPPDLLALPQVRDSFLEAARYLGRAAAPTFSQKGGELEQAVSRGDLQAALDALLTKDKSPKARKFGDKLAGIEAVRAAQDLALELCAARSQHGAWLHHRRIARLARILLREFAALKRAHGWVDMNDVEHAALQLLGNPELSGWVQERLDQQVRHLLVDEFQDTNPMQWLALRQWLESYAGAGTAPSVFIVGDPKQSIYRFRRAEPQVFRAAQSFIAGALGGDRLSCDHTYRNSQQVLAAVNQVFGDAQRGFEFEGFRAHTTESKHAGSLKRLPQVTREARERDEQPEVRQWRDSLLVPRETPEEKLATRECRQAAAWIAAEIARGRKPGEIMVLARRRERLSEMEAQLRPLHVPAQQPENTDLRDAPEVQDVIALLDVLVSTSHDLSLARALKSPIFGVDDAHLVEIALLARAQPARSWFDLLHLAQALPEPLAQARDRLTAWKRLVDRLPPHDALQAIYSEGDVLARFAAAAPAPMREVVLANLRALLGAALAVDGGRYLTPYAFVRALRAGGIEGPAVVAEGAVRLLTVHGAKGLEAQVVLILDTDAAPPGAETMGVLCDWPGEEAAPRRFAFITSESRPPACSANWLQAEQDARRREEMNGLYVAMTRAEETLVISSVQPHRRAATTWWERLEALASAVEAPDGFDAPVESTPAQLPGFTLRTLPAVTWVETKPPVREEETSDDSRFGQAVHRLLEFAHPGQGAFPPERLRRVAREFQLDPARAEQAAVVAGRILTGDGQWAWDTSVVDWHANEVPLNHGGQSLRVDRLVRRAATGEWWVLDYKSKFTPQDDAALVAQMARYREALRAIHPSQPVRCAFLSGDGRLLEVE